LETVFQGWNKFASIIPCQGKKEKGVPIWAGIPFLAFLAAISFPKNGVFPISGPG